MAWRATTKKSTRKGVDGEEYVKLEANKNVNWKARVGWEGRERKQLLDAARRRGALVVTLPARGEVGFRGAKSRRCKVT
jgi:hypothetical protein